MSNRTARAVLIGLSLLSLALLGVVLYPFAGALLFGAVLAGSFVGLVDRLARNDLIVREPSAVDRRKVELRLSPRGRRVLARLAAAHRGELQRIGPIMKRFFSELGPDRAGD